MVYFLAAFLSSCILTVFSLRKSGRKLATVFAVLALLFSGWIVYEWGGHMLSVMSEFDGRRMYMGISKEGLPYAAGLKDDQTPTFWAFGRTILGLTDGSFSSYQRILSILNYGGLVVIAICVAAVSLYARKEGSISSLSVISLVGVYVAGLLPAFRNIEVGNTNIMVAALASIFVASVHLSRSNVGDVLGGIALGAAFMIKPYLLIVLVFVLFSSLTKKRLGHLAGLIIAGSLGFLTSLMARDIGLDTYIYFLTVARKLIYYHWSSHPLNLSLLRQAPVHMLGMASAVAILFFSIFAVLDSRKPGSTVLYWFFPALLPFPILWDAHLFGVFPAFLFFLSGKGESEQVIVWAVAVTLIYCSCVVTIPLMVNILLLGMWLWGIAGTRSYSFTRYTSGEGRGELLRLLGV